MINDDILDFYMVLSSLKNEKFTEMFPEAFHAHCLYDVIIKELNLKYNYGFTNRIKYTPEEFRESIKYIIEEIKCCENSCDYCISFNNRYDGFECLRVILE